VLSLYEFTEKNDTTFFMCLGVELLANLVAWKVVDITKGPKQVRDGKDWSSQLDLLWIIIYLNPLAIISTVFLQSNIFTYLSFFLFLFFSVKNYTLFSIILGAFTIFLDYQFGILVVFSHVFFSWRTSSKMIFGKLFMIYAIIASFIYIFFEKNYFTIIYFNVAKINEVGESINPIWYFFVECFDQYVKIFICFFTIYPFVYVLPLVRLTIRTSDYYHQFEQLEHSNENVIVRELGSNNKPLAHKKLRSPLDKRPMLEERQ
jgi:hypothetical protein